MYLEYWGFREPPFSNAPSESFFFRSPQHEEALSRLLYVIDNRRGVAMLTGEVGCGKTTVTKALMKYLSQDSYCFRLLSNPALDPLDLIRAILIKFGKNTVNGSKPILLSQLQELLVDNERRGLSTVLAIDEAHVVDRRDTMDEIRMLLNLQHREKFLITLILLGQPPLLKRISELQPLKERISVKYNLEPLNADDCLRYILFRLRSAGSNRGFFTNEAVAPLYEYSGGIPLRINNLCDRCLLIGYLQKSSRIDSAIVREAIKDLE